MSSLWNNRINISIFGEADGPAIGVTIENLPSGEYIDTEAIAAFMARRTAFDDAEGGRRNAGLPRIMSGISGEKTTGMPLCAFVNNTPVKAKKPDERDVLTRPGHADYTGAVRYRGYDDVKVRADFTEKLTIPLCFAGAVCAQILERRGIYTGAHIASIHNIKDNPFDPVNITRDAVLSIRGKKFPVINDSKGWLMVEDMRRASEGGESLGGVIECAAVNVPAGVGSPILGGLENSIAQLVFGIPGVKGLEFGAGFLSAKMLGSQSSDDFYIDSHGHSVTKTNNHGGILGGISSGMPITLRAAVMPSPIDGEGQRSCTVPGAAVCVEAAVNIALLSHMLDYPNFC